MKRMAYLAVSVLVALVIIVPTASAQGMMEDTTMMDNNNMMQGNDMMMQQPQMMDQSMMMQPQMMNQPMMQQPQTMGQSMTQPKSQMMPNTGGISLQSLLLPAAALIIGAGLLAGYVVRRR